jgi:lipopolysaccharide biosynthesis glycosyltransferase
MLIALTTDRNYVELAGVLLRSIVTVGKVDDAELVVCGDGLSQVDRDRLLACTRGRPITFLGLGKMRARIAGMQLGGNRTLIVYARVLLPDLLPDRNGKLLYLDCDTLITSDLRPLFETSIDRHALAAVPVAKTADYVAELNRHFGRPPQTPYFNSGVMLIDLEEWHRRGLTGQTLDWAVSNHNLIRYVDQDALNAAVHGDFCPLDWRWNCYGDHDPSAAAIVHFVHQKPHFQASRHPMLHVWREHRSFTPWAGKPLVSNWARRRNKLVRKLRGTILGELFRASA